MQPVCLFACLKPGKGNTEMDIPIFPRKRSLSINGESILSPDLLKMNIHNFAHFENPEKLVPGFFESIKKRSRGEGIGKTPSFQNVATQVLAMEKVLLRWPKRPRARHHSSSSEDGLDTDDVDSIASANIGQDFACDAPENANGCIGSEDVDFSVAPELTKTDVSQMEHESVSVDNVHAVCTNSESSGCEPNKSSSTVLCCCVLL